jgi:hypothetical protein
MASDYPFGIFKLFFKITRLYLYQKELMGINNLFNVTNLSKRLLSFISEYFKACDILDFSYVHKSSVYNINEQRIFIIRGNR